MAPTTATAEIDLTTTTNMGTKHASESRSGDADPKRVPELILDGQPPAGSPPYGRQDDLAIRPRWLLDKAGDEDWGTAEWLRWERLRKRFVYLRVEPRYFDQAGGLVSCTWLDDDAVGLPTISSTLRNGDQLPTLDALTRLMEAVATARLRQVRDSLDSTE
jgi:hypothetical protein